VRHLAAQLAWPKVKALAQGGALALLPVGSTEAHGPHLPLGVDVLIAEEVCRRVSERLGVDVVQFPAITYSLTDFAAPFAGTISLAADTAQALLEGVLAGIAAAGFSRIGVVNHHLEPAHFKVVHAVAKAVNARSGAGHGSHPVTPGGVAGSASHDDPGGGARAGVGEGPSTPAGLRGAPSARVVVVDHRRAPTGPLLGEEFMHGGSHAGNYETSLMLAAAPQLVDEAARLALPELAVDLPAAIKAGAKSFLECGGPDAYLGSPATASAAEGERLFELLTISALAALAG
jgi:creatinine amidohydrolase